VLSAPRVGPVGTGTVVVVVVCHPKARKAGMYSLFAVKAAVVGIVDVGISVVYLVDAEKTTVRH